MSLLLPPLLLGMGCWVVLALQPAGPAPGPAPLVAPGDDPSIVIKGGVSPLWPPATSSLAIEIAEGATTGTASLGRPWHLVSKGTGPCSRAPSPLSAPLGESGHHGLALSGDGLLVAFASDADDLTRGDLNGCSDVFLYDAVSEHIQRVSTSRADRPGPSLQPALSADGRWLAFTSYARDLLTEDDSGIETGRWADVYIWDRLLASTVRISSTPAGTEPGGSSGEAALSGDGRLVVYTSSADDIVAGDHNRHSDVLLHDRVTGTTRLISANVDARSGNGHSHHPVISGNGQIIAYVSAASDLACEGPADHNSTADIFVHDLTTGLSRRIDLGGADHPFRGGPGQRPSLSLSWDGSVLAYVARSSAALATDREQLRAAPRSRVYVVDFRSGVTQLASVGADGAPLIESCSAVSLSHDGRLVAFASTLQPPYQDVLIFDRHDGCTRLVGAAGAGSRSGDHSRPHLAGDASLLALVSSRRLHEAGEHEGGDVILVPLGVQTSSSRTQRP